MLQMTGKIKDVDLDNPCVDRRAFMMVFEVDGEEVVVNIKYTRRDELMNAFGLPSTQKVADLKKLIGMDAELDALEHKHPVVFVYPRGRQTRVPTAYNDNIAPQLLGPTDLMLKEATIEKLQDLGRFGNGLAALLPIRDEKGEIYMLALEPADIDPFLDHMHASTYKRTEGVKVGIRVKGTHVVSVSHQGREFVPGLAIALWLSDNELAALHVKRPMDAKLRERLIIVGWMFAGATMFGLLNAFFEFVRPYMH